MQYLHVVSEKGSSQMLPSQQGFPPFSQGFSSGMQSDSWAWFRDEVKAEWREWSRSVKLDLFFVASDELNKMRKEYKAYTRPVGTCYRYLRRVAFQFLYISLPQYLPHMENCREKNLALIFSSITFTIKR